MSNEMCPALRRAPRAPPRRLPSGAAVAGRPAAGLPGALRGQGIPAPDYPPEARRRGEQGVVKVAIEVLPDGSLGEIHVVSDPGYPLLRDADLAATQKLRRFPFTPAYALANRCRMSSSSPITSSFNSPTGSSRLTAAGPGPTFV